MKTYDEMGKAEPSVYEKHINILASKTTGILNDMH